MSANTAPGVWRKYGWEIDSTGWPLVIVRFPKQPEPIGYQAAFGHYVELAGRERGCPRWKTPPVYGRFLRAELVGAI